MGRLLLLPDDGSGMTLQAAKEVIRRGGVLAIPTESFYALAASPWDAAAVRRVCAIKGRPEGKPILVLIADRTQLDGLIAERSPAATVLIERFWPGPLTLIFTASQALPNVLTAGTGTIGIRQTAYPALLPLLRAIGPLTGTSANRSGQAPAQTAQEVQAALSGELDLILDAGPTPGGMPSTMVDTVGRVRILRSGPVTGREIESVLAGMGAMVEVASADI